MPLDLKPFVHFFFYSPSTWQQDMYYFRLLIFIKITFFDTTFSIYISYVNVKGVPKKVDWAKYHNRNSSKIIWVIKLSFCQNDSPMGGPCWQKGSFITHILFEVHMPIMIFCPVYLFSGHPLVHGRSSFYRVLLLLLVWPYGLH